MNTHFSCPNCARDLTGYVNFVDLPKPEDTTVCNHCACMLQYDKNLKLQILPPNVFLALPEAKREELNNTVYLICNTHK